MCADWRRRFYPRALPARARLPFYAGRFDTLRNPTSTSNNDARAFAVENARRLVRFLNPSPPERLSVRESMTPARPRREAA
ncbi:MAG: hypothetical protein ACREMB_05680 [Candidatus Rokuibacteriota bacterium]